LFLNCSITLFFCCHPLQLLLHRIDITKVVRPNTAGNANLPDKKTDLPDGGGLVD
jgi:hypothetical protein